MGQSQSDATSSSSADTAAAAETSTAAVQKPKRTRMKRCCKRSAKSNVSTAKHRKMELSDLPLEMLETVLMRAFLMIYCVSDDDRLGKSTDAECRAFTVLSSVCWNWYLTLTGWPDSPTGQWVRHRLMKLVEYSCWPFQRSPLMKYELSGIGLVFGVTRLRDVVCIVRDGSSAIVRFSATTHQRLKDVDIEDLRRPCDIAACQQTSQLYVADFRECIWRVSSEGEEIQRWPPELPSDSVFLPFSLSVTSARLLVTSLVNELTQFDAVGDEVRAVELPDYIDPEHAVESPTGTFVVSHANALLDQSQVSEVNTEGEVLRQFSGPLGDNLRSAVDSRGNVLVADCDGRRVLLLDARLALRRVIIDEHQLNNKGPRCLCYHEQSGQLLVGFFDHVSWNGGIAMFDVLRR